MGDGRIREYVSWQSTGVCSSLALRALILGRNHQPRPPPVLCTLAYRNSVSVKHYLPFHASLHTRSAAPLSLSVSLLELWEADCSRKSRGEESDHIGPLEAGFFCALLRDSSRCL